MDKLLQPLILVPCAVLAMLLIFACSSSVQQGASNTIRRLFGVQAQFAFVVHFKTRFGTLRDLFSQPFRFVIWSMRKTGANLVLWMVYGFAVYGCLLWLCGKGCLAILTRAGITFGIEAGWTNWLWTLPCIVFSCAITDFVAKRVCVWSHALCDYFVKVIYDYHNCLRSIKAEMEEQAPAVPQLDTVRGRRTFSQSHAQSLAEAITNPKPAPPIRPVYRPSFWNGFKKKLPFSARPQKQVQTLTEEKLAQYNQAMPQGLTTTLASTPPTSSSQTVAMPPTKLPGAAAAQKSADKPDVPPRQERSSNF
jgi:hypothetical protein